jgi:hypothetical protein
MKVCTKCHKEKSEECFANIGKYILRKRASCKECEYTKRPPNPLYHGMSRSRFYRTWVGLNVRCNNPKAKGYHNYGGRGIAVLWRSYMDFYNDMNESYLDHVKIHGEQNTTIDRKNNNGHYCKQNCEWATIKEQTNKKRTNKYITYQGTTKTLSQWAAHLNYKKATLAARLGQCKWSVDKAFNTPVIPRNHKLLTDLQQQA